MKLEITQEERELLQHLGHEAESRKAAFEAAVRDFRLAFEMAMRARRLTDVAFVSLGPDGLTVEQQKPALSLVQDVPDGDAA